MAIKVVVKNLQGDVTNSATFDSQGEVDAWISEQVSLRSFGKPERWLTEQEIAVQGEDKYQAIEQEEYGAPDEHLLRYKFAAQYTIEQSDVTAEIADKADSDKDEMAEAFSASILHKIRKINRKKLRDNIWDLQKVRDLKADTVLMGIKDDIRDGFFGIALLDLNAADVTAFYSSMEKAEILSLLTEANSATM